MVSKLLFVAFTREWKKQSITGTKALPDGHSDKDGDGATREKNEIDSQAC
jgi:hypothetical protein